MKIIDNTVTIIPFDEILIGNIFKDKNGGIWMRGNNVAYGANNSINLKTCETTCFAPSEPVTPLPNARLVID